MFEMDEVLQADRSGRCRGRWSPGMSRAAGDVLEHRGEHDGAGVDPDSAFWAVDVQRAVAGPVGGHRVGHDRGPGRGGPSRKTARVARTAE